MFRKVLIVANVTVAFTFSMLALSSGGSLAAILVFLVALLLAVNAAALATGVEVGVPGVRLWRIWRDWLLVTEADLSIKAMEIRQHQRPL